MGGVASKFFDHSKTCSTIGGPMHLGNLKCAGIICIDRFGTEGGREPLSAGHLAHALP